MDKVLCKVGTKIWNQAKYLIAYGVMYCDDVELQVYGYDDYGKDNWGMDKPADSADKNLKQA